MTPLPLCPCCAWRRPALCLYQHRTFPHAMACRDFVHEQDAALADHIGDPT